MKTQEKHAVTGAFGYSGQYITRRLLDKGHEVISLTNSTDRFNPFGDKVKAQAFHFDHPDKLIDSLRGVKVIYNTYWVRFNHKTFTHEAAVQNTFTLFKAAKAAGVERIVHISITNPSESSPYEYFSGKARMEKALIESGLSHAILRPAVLFGKEDILINNIAWMLRKFPVFGVFGDGNYKMQPIYVDDLARLAVDHGEAKENVIVDAIGPETFTYRDLVRELAGIMGINRPIWSIPPWLGFLIGKVVGSLVGDVIITKPEIGGLMDGLLFVESKASGSTKLTDWAKANSDTIGRHYTSELARRLDRKGVYQSN
ncbi:MAG: NAD(P)H-binding protein [Spirochaetota bacterium]|nr:NAD(P)H-binding protein [Spirochaetota bacterium]